MAALARDDLIRANNTDFGTNWDENTADSDPGGFDISGNTGVPANRFGDSSETYNAVTCPPDQYSEITFSATAAEGVGSGVGVSCREATAAKTMYRAVANASGYELARFVAAAFTSLSSGAGTTFAAGDKLRLTVKTVDLNCVWWLSKNGVVFASGTDTAPIASGRFGVAHSSTTTASAIASWEGGNLEPLLLVAPAIPDYSPDENDFDVASWAGVSLASWFDEDLFVPASAISGTVAVTPAADTSAASGSVTGVAGSIAKTNANDTSAASGIVTVTGTIAKTAGNDTSSAAGAVTVTGTVAKTNANDTSAAAGKVTVTGTVAKTNANDTSSASGIITDTGTIAKTEGADTSAASGTVSGGGISGTVAKTEGADTSAASGASTVTGTIARTGGADSSAASGQVTVSGTIARTNANDSAAGAGTVTASGSVARTEAPDSSAANGTVSGTGTITGTIAALEGRDSSAAAGTVSGVGTDLPVTYYGRGKRKLKPAIVKDVAARTKLVARKPDPTAEDVVKYWDLVELRKRQAKKAGEPPQVGDAPLTNAPSAEGPAPGPAAGDGEADAALPVEAKPKPKPKAPVPVDAATLQVRKVVEDAKARAERDKLTAEAVEDLEELEMLMLMAVAVTEDDE